MRRFTLLVALFTLTFSSTALAVAPAAEDGSLSSLAEASLRSGQYGVAAVLARKAVQAEPACVKPYLVLGLSLDRLEDYEGAAEAYRVVASRTPQRHKTLLLLGHALKRSGDIEGAVRVFSQAEAEKNPRADMLTKATF